MSLITDLARDSVYTIKNEGVGPFVSKARNFLKLYGATHWKKVETSVNGRIYKDVLFINGCDASVPHPARYRVTHQREQLEGHRISTDEVYYLQLDPDMVRFFRTFIFFRCPYTDTIGEFIRRAKELNKQVIFDIDDLVIDTKYTDTIPYVQGLNGQEKGIYDDGVIRMGRTLSLCDAAVTTTERLAEELRHYVPEVYINRNTASEAMQLYSEEALNRKTECKEKVRLGYFSGSYTHNADFELIKPVLKKLFERFPQMELHLTGELDLPDDLEKYQERIVTHPFVDWEKLPELVAGVEINLGPLEKGIFNEAKSENKWVEAALVKVPTVASSVGAFKRMIVHNETGLLCNNETEWEDNLSRLIMDEEERRRLAENAYEYCTKHCTTLGNSNGIAAFIRAHMTPNIAFVVPPMTISGGIMVVLQHAVMLRKAGVDVMLLEENGSRKWIEYQGVSFPVLSRELRLLAGRIDKEVATLWSTINDIEHYPNIGQRYYLVQNYEAGFYHHDDPRRNQAFASYHPRVPVRFITISKWCKKWIEEDMGQACDYAPNGLNPALFSGRKRKWNREKIRILVEGNCGVDYKNVDESFRIVNLLDPEKYEVWYLSYNSKPKEWYHVDRFFNRVPYEKVGKIYAKCDILLKTSVLESFSYPPLEMMSTGGYVVAVPNDGNREYLIHEYNCLLYKRGDIEAGAAAIHRIVEDQQLREKLYIGGLETAAGRTWEQCKPEILKLYGVLEQAGRE